MRTAHEGRDVGTLRIFDACVCRTMNLTGQNDVGKRNAVLGQRPPLFVCGHSGKVLIQQRGQNRPKAVARVHIIKARRARRFGRKRAEDQDPSIAVIDWRKWVKNAHVFGHNKRKRPAYCGAFVVLRFGHRRDVDRNVGERERAARMDVTEFLIRKPSAVHRGGDIHVAGDQFGVAPTASAAAAIGRGVQARRFHRAQEGSVCVAGDRRGHARDRHGQSKLLINVAGVIGALFGVEEFTEQLVPHKLATNAQFFNFLIRKVVHRLRSAHKDREVTVRRVFLDQVGGDKAAFAPLLLLVGEHVDQLDLVTLGRHFADLVAEDGVGVRTTAVQQDQRAGFIPFVDGFCKRAERRDAAAACNADHGFCIAQTLVREVTQRRGCRKLGAHRPVVQNVLRNDAAVHALDRQHIDAVQGVG